MTDDVVAELDRWLDEWVTAIIDRTLVQRARDAIVAMRQQIGPNAPARAALAAENAGTEVIIRESDGAVFIRQDVAERVGHKARAEALEEAAKACESRVAYARALCPTRSATS